MIYFSLIKKINFSIFYNIIFDEFSFSILFIFSNLGLFYNLLLLDPSMDFLNNILGLEVEKLEPYQMATRAFVIFFTSLLLYIILIS